MRQLQHFRLSGLRTDLIQACMAKTKDILHLRPKPTQWFETYIPRDQTVYALEALALTGLVQLQSDPRFASPIVIDEVKEVVRDFDQLVQRYSSGFPSQDIPLPKLTSPPEQTGLQAIKVLRHFCARFAWLRRKERQAVRALDNLSLIMECLDCMGEDKEIFKGLLHKSHFLSKRIFVCDKTIVLPEAVNDSVYMQVVGDDHDFYIDAALPGQHGEIDYVFSDCREITIPAWLMGDCKEREACLKRHVVELKQEIDQLRQQLQALNGETEPADAYARLRILKWFVENSPKLAGKEHLCHVTGWTSAETVDELNAALNSARIDANIRFSETPVGVKPPVLGFQSKWAAPFHVFIDLLGAPDTAEIDPSVLLPIIVPLLFGFMFPDIGHGLVLLLAGLVMSSHPKLRLLIPCGLYSIAFGFLFGSFFGRHDVVQPLWFHPMDEPVKVLVVCLIFGFCLIMLSIVFSGIEAFWKGKLKRWLMLELAVLFFFASGLIGIFVHEVLLLMPVALALYIFGIVASSRGNAMSNLLTGIGNLVQSTFELLLNTISFLRVGIFALAHDGMSLALIVVTEGMENIYLQGTFLVLGHLIIIIIETLIVFIQTTRLVLFEFFIRFFHAEGRVFQPLNLPFENSG